MFFVLFIFVGLFLFLFCYFAISFVSVNRVEALINAIVFIMFCSFLDVIYIHCTEYFVLHDNFLK